MSKIAFLLVVVLATYGCVTQSDDATILTIPNDAKEVNVIATDNGVITELTYMIWQPRNDTSNGELLYEQLQEQGYTPCPSNSSQWVRASKTERNDSEKNHRFLWFLKNKAGNSLVTVAITQTCSENQDKCEQEIYARITRFPWWVLTRPINIKNICG